MKQYSAKAVANFFLRKAWNEGKTLTPMKLQKLVYLAHGWALGAFDAPLISESVQAWQYGPVIESLYHEFKHFGSGDIDKEASDVDLDHETFDIVYEVPVIDEDDSEAQDLINRVWNTYERYSGGQLSTITHRPGTPWKKAYTGERGTIIDNHLIKEHYKNLIEKRTNPSAEK